MRDELPNTPFLTSSDGASLCESISGKKFIETSSKDDKNTSKVIETAVRSLLPEKILPKVSSDSKMSEKSTKNLQKPRIVVTSESGEDFDVKKSGCCAC